MSLLGLGGDRVFVSFGAFLEEFDSPGILFAVYYYNPIDTTDHRSAIPGGSVSIPMTHNDTSLTLQTKVRVKLQLDLSNPNLNVVFL